MVDTHCHLYLEEYDTDREEVINVAQQSGIDTILLPNVDTSTVERMHHLCDEYPGFAFPMMGLHPTSVDNSYSGNLRQIESCLKNRQYYAIGEIGIDLYWDKTFLKEQKIVFEEQLQWSIDLDLPVSIHTREAFPEVLDSILKVGCDKLRGVFHSFSGNDNDLYEIKQLKHFKLGINGVVTFKNSGLSDIIAKADIKDIVLETDAPYLSPVPYRGKRNEPVYLWKTAEKVADIFDLSMEDTVKLTGENALKLFNIGK